MFLTKIDTYDPDVIGQHLKKTFHSERLLSLMEVSIHAICAWTPKLTLEIVLYNYGIIIKMTGCSLLKL